MQLVFRQFRFYQQESSPSRKATESCSARNMPYCRRASHAQTLALNKMAVEQYRYQRYNYRSYYQYIYTQIQLDVRYSRLSVPVQYSSYSIGSSSTSAVPVATCGKVRSLEVLTQVQVEVYRYIAASLVVRPLGRCTIQQIVSTGTVQQLLYRQQFDH